MRSHRDRAVLKFIAQFEHSGPFARSLGSGSKAGPIVGTFPRCGFHAGLDPLGEFDLHQRRDLGVEDNRGAGFDRVMALVGDIGGEDRGQRQQSDHNAARGGQRSSSRRGSPGTPARRRAVSVSAERTERQPDSNQDLRRQRQDAPRPSAKAPAPQPARHEDRPGAGTSPGAGNQRGSSAASGKGRQRHRGDDDRGADRAQPPAFDQQ